MSQRMVESSPLSGLAPLWNIGWASALSIVKHLLGHEHIDFARLDILFPGRVLDSMPYDSTTRPVLPFVHLSSLAMDWALDKGLSLYHPGAGNRWAQYGYDDKRRAQRVVDALDRDAAKHGKTLHCIASHVPDDNEFSQAYASTSHHKFPWFFVALCNKARVPFLLSERWHSKHPECYYAADANGVEWTTQRLPGVQAR
jgi:hypothetical protein